MAARALGLQNPKTGRPVDKPKIIESVRNQSVVSVDKFKVNIKIIESTHKKSFDKSLDILLKRILYEITQIDYQEKMVKFLEEGYQGIEIVSHIKLCYLRDHFPMIYEKIYDQLVKCDLIKRDTTKNRQDFLNIVRSNPELVFYIQSNDLGNNPPTSFSLVLTKPYLTTVNNGKNNVLIINKLPYGTHFLGECL